jgi:creatinine amidohydrolase
MSGISISSLCELPAMNAWERSTSRQIGERVATNGRSLAVFPIGATEQHGAHLATGTDTFLVERICREACQRRGILKLPALPFGCSYGHTEKWPGTLSLSPTLLTEVLCEISRWAINGSGVDRLFFISGHATNGPSIESAILQLRYEYPRVRFAYRGLWEISAKARGIYAIDAPDMHANLAETAMMLAIEPDGVDMKNARDVADVTIGKFWRYAMPAVTPNGVVGRPSEASASAGETMLEEIIQDLEKLLVEAEAEGWPNLP